MVETEPARTEGKSKEKTPAFVKGVAKRKKRGKSCKEEKETQKAQVKRAR